MANITRKLELANNQIINDIKKQEENLSINKIEFTYQNCEYTEQFNSEFLIFKNSSVLFF